MECFLPFYPLNEPENQDFEKMKKAPGDIIILHMCAINDINYNNMMYGSWEFFVILTIFCHFIHLATQKINISKKWKRHLEILSCYTCVPNRLKQDFLTESSIADFFEFSAAIVRFSFLKRRMGTRLCLQLIWRCY